jgi:hypothetical protein
MGRDRMLPSLPNSLRFLFFLFFGVLCCRLHMYALDRWGDTHSFMHSLGSSHCCSQSLAITPEPLHETHFCFVILQNRFD